MTSVRADVDADMAVMKSAMTLEGDPMAHGAHERMVQSSPKLLSAHEGSDEADSFSAA